MFLAQCWQSMHFSHHIKLQLIHFVKVNAACQQLSILISKTDAFDNSVNAMHLSGFVTLNHLTATCEQIVQSSVKVVRGYTTIILSNTLRPYNSIFKILIITVIILQKSTGKSNV